MDQLYEYAGGLALVYAAFGLGLLTPGPNIVAVIATSMSVSRKAGVSLASGVACGTCLWSLFAAAGLAAILAKYAFLLFYLKILGGLYLLWMAYKVLKSAASRDERSIEMRAGCGKSYNGYMLKGLIIQMSNPKAALAWFAILPLCIDAQAPASVWIAIIVGTTTMSLTGHLIYAFAFSSAPAIAAYGKARRLIESGIGAFFTFAGFKLLLSNS